jgi:putative RNA 2'-phosphotransferase
MNLTKLSKVVSHALRHDPQSYGIRLEKDGWVSITDLYNALRNKEQEFRDIKEEEIYEMVLSAKKQRHEIKNGKIRAMYGHSAEVNIRYPTIEPPVDLYHGTSKEAADKILSEGLKPMERLYVHLSADKNVAQVVGSRKTEVPVILKIKAVEASKEGIKFYAANKDTWLTEFVPPDFISDNK